MVAKEVRLVSPPDGCLWATLTVSGLLVLMGILVLAQEDPAGFGFLLFAGAVFVVGGFIAAIWHNNY